MTYLVLVYFSDVFCATQILLFCCIVTKIKKSFMLVFSDATFRDLPTSMETESSNGKEGAVMSTLFHHDHHL